MKSRLFLLAAAASLLAFSCAKENKEGKGPEKDGFVTISISAASEGTKTSLGEPADGKRQISWVKDDEIKVVWGSGSSDFAIAQAESDGASTTFTVSVPEGVTTLYAVYPAGAFESFSDGSLSVNVPAVQNGQFASANIAVARSTVEQASFAFKNVCSYILTDITGAGVGRVTVSAEGQALCGKVPVSFSEAGEAVLGTFSETASSVMASGLSVGPCAIAVLPGLDFTSGVNVKFSDSEGAEISQVNLKKEHTLIRGEVLSTGALDDATIISYFADPAADGNGDGLSSETPWNTEQLITWLKASNPEVPELKTPDAPFNISLADGTYNFGSQYATVGEKGGRDINIFSPGGNSVITCAADTVTSSLIVFGIAGKISISDVTFTGRNLNQSGRGILVFSKPSSGDQEVTLNGCTFTGNSNKRISASLILNNAGTNYINNCVFTNNKAGAGSAVNIDNASTTCTFTGCTFSGNEGITYSSNADAGAVKIGNGTAIFSGCKFENNTISSSNGGGAAVMVANIASIKATFKDNCQFLSNTSVAGGGAVYVLGGDVEFDNCQFKQNESKYGSAAALGTLGNHAVVTFNVVFKNGCNFEDNVSINGGAVFLPGGDKNNASTAAGTFSIDGCTFKNNSISSGGGGGAIRMAQAAGKTVTIKDTEFKSNSAKSNGGGIANYQNTNLEINHCTFDSNTIPSGYGGAIYIGGEGECHNTIHVFGNTSFTGNHGNDGGGCIAVSNNGNGETSSGSGTYRTCYSNLTVEDCSFTNNNSVAKGGAIDFKSSGTCNISSSTFDGNYTTQTNGNGCGAALNLEYGQTGSTIRGTVNISDCCFTGNYTKAQELTSGNDPRGGAIAISGVTKTNYNYLDVRINKCYFANNVARQAAAIRCYEGVSKNGGASLFINASSFEGNSTYSNNGLVAFVYAAKEFGMNNCSFRNNFGPVQGAAGLNWVSIATTPSVISNTTMVGQIQKKSNDESNLGTGGGLLRFEGGASTYDLINNLIASTQTWCSSVMAVSSFSGTINSYSNKFSSTSNITPANTDAYHGTDWLGTTAYFGGLAWAANSTSGEEYKSGWNWNGTLATGTPATMNTRGDVKAKIQAANAGFYTWLQSVDGLDKDQRGNARGNADTDPIWPGSFQN